MSNTQITKKLSKTSIYTILAQVNRVDAVSHEHSDIIPSSVLTDFLCEIRLVDTYGSSSYVNKLISKIMTKYTNQIYADLRK